MHVHLLKESDYLNRMWTMTNKSVESILNHLSYQMFVFHFAYQSVIYFL